jgi:hypothetical protein
MRRTQCLHTIGFVAFASLVACSDTSQPVDPLAATPGRSGQSAITCKPATPDSLSPPGRAIPGCSAGRV